MKKHQPQQAVQKDPRKKAVFLDLDGTLWDREVVPESAWKAIRKAQENGHKIFINTGRSRDNIPDFLWRAGFDGFGLSTGMELAGKEGTLKKFYLDRDKALSAAQWLESKGCGFSLEKTDLCFDSPKYAFRRQIFLEKEGRPEFTHRKPLSQITPEDLQTLAKVSFDTEVPFDEELLAEADSRGFDVLFYRTRYNPTNGFSSFMRGELTDKSVTKATAMASLLKAEGLNPDEWHIAAIGDSENDIPMMQEADSGICMGNGTPAAKEAADYITAPIHEDGLARAFAWLGLLDDVSGHAAQV